MSRVPERGDIVWLDMDPSTGHEQTGRQPALALSPQRYNGKVGLAMFCPVTTTVKGYPFEVPLPEGLPIEGVVLADHAKSLDWVSRHAEFVCALPPSDVTAVLTALGRLLAAD